MRSFLVSYSLKVINTLQLFNYYFKEILMDIFQRKKKTIKEKRKQNYSMKKLNCKEERNKSWGMSVGTVFMP